MPNWTLAGGTLFDGTGAPGFAGWLEVSGERITAITPGEPPALPGQVLDVHGCFVTPGFIDMHSHGDEGYLVVPDADSKVRQGITLDVCGNCGFSVSPMRGAKREEARRSLARLQLDPTWEDMAGFRRRLEEQGIAINLAFLVGHGALRGAVVGYAARPASAEEQRAMARLLEQELSQGAIGMSTGLIYPPGSFAPTEEIIALARVARAGGLYASHIRGEGDTLLESIDEALRIGRAADIRVEISHLKAAGPRNWPKLPEALARIDAARNEGVTVACDQYPYPASSTGLRSVVPDWAHAGGTEALLARLRNPAERARIKEAVAAARPPEAWSDVTIATAPTAALRPYQGSTVAAIAEQRGCPPEEAVLEVILEGEGQVGGIFFSQSEENVRRVLTRPDVSVGTDSGVASPHGLTGEGHPHPRTYGTFPRILGRYVRDERILSWETAVHKMTGRAADALAMADRGVLRARCFADLVVFEPEVIADAATYARPHQFPAGVRHVFVNGTPVVRDGEPTGARPGRVLTR
jgi:N-acyl-D-amino-acid deacylase